MNKLLLIFELVPDELILAGIPLNHPMINVIRGAQGAEINVDEPTDEQQDGVEYINEGFGESGELNQYRLEAHEMNDEFHGVVVAKFYL